ncbi:hypothetical protein [Nonomuraea sp. KM90]|uniref:hypothetical protein n=1 Tax=Nonomuraea sp. KM90 TaxID=3457428 RepID=UPI003FCCFBF9
MAIPMDIQFRKTDLYALPVKVTAVRNGLVTALGATSRDARYSIEHREKLAEKLREEATAQLDQIEREADRAVQDITTWLDKQPSAPGDPQRELLDEVKRQSAWSRAKALLDKGMDVQALIKDAAVSKDVATLTALRTEWPVYARTGTNRELHPRASAEILDGIERGLADALSGDQGAAARLRIRTDESREVLKRALSEARNHVQRLTDNPTGELHRNERLADVEANSTGMAIINGQLVKTGGRSGSEFPGGHTAR